MWKLAILSVVLAMVSVFISPPHSLKAQSENPAPYLLWIEPTVPDDFTLMLQPLIDSGKYQTVVNPDQAQLQVRITGGGGAVTSQWLYVPVLSFASLPEGVRYFDIQRYWSGDTAVLTALSDGITPPQLVVIQDVLDVLKLMLGEPAPAVPIQVVSPDVLITALWQQRPNSWSLVPFHQLSPDLKVLALDGMNIFGADFALEEYPLRVNIGIEGEDQALGKMVEDLLAVGTWQGTNRDPNKLTRLVLTGVTALTRATAHKMEVNGLTYPAQQIMPFLQDADILHTSNEVPFSDNCPPADPFLSTTIFCSDNRYMELLTYMGLDVVELTGNHVNDYGPGAFRHSLEMYDEVGMGYYGGGRTIEAARAAYISEHNGNTIAFIGCNVPGPFKAWVSLEREGAAQCDEAFLSEELPRLAQSVDIVVMSVQQWEYYRYQVGSEQVSQFTNYATLGADVVIGSQAHQPQGFSFIPRQGDHPAFLHHGLGNLFFDQMADLGTRRMFIDKIIIYDGRLMSVVLFTGLIEDYCCPRPMTEAERAEFLNLIFSVSTWEQR